MSSHHSFSISLFNKLFKFNMVSRDGYVKATDSQLLKFKEYLKQETAENTANLYKKRKEMVDEVLSLLDEDRLNLRQCKRMIMLLHKLNMKVTKDGMLEVIPSTPGKRNTPETSSPKVSIWEQKMDAEERRLKALKRDLKLLDDWLRELSNPKSKVHKCLPKKSGSGDAQHDECRRTIKKIMRIARRNVKFALKDSDSDLTTEKSWKPEDSKDKNQKTHSSTESCPKQTLDALLATEERNRKASKNATKGSKSSKTKVSEEDSKGTDSREDDTNHEEAHTEIQFDKNAKWEEDIRNKVFWTSTPKKRSKRNKLLTHVHDVKRFSKLQLQTKSDESLVDVLHFFPVLQMKVFEDKASPSNEDEEYCEDFESDSDEERIPLSLENYGDLNGETETVEYPSCGELELTLDEILRKEQKRGNEAD